MTISYIWTNDKAKELFDLLQDQMRQARTDGSQDIMDFCTAEMARLMGIYTTVRIVCTEQEAAFVSA